MRYRPNRQEVGRMLKSQQFRRPLTMVGGRVLATARTTVARDSGETAASGRLTHLNRAGVKGDRIGVQVSFRGAAVQLQFGNKNMRARRFLTRALL